MQRVPTLLLLTYLLSLGLLPPAALASDGPDVEQVRFTWTTDGRPALVRLTLPRQLEIGSVQGASLPGAARLAGFAVEADPPALELYPLIAEGEVLAFSVVDLRLQGGAERRFEFGEAVVVSLAPGTGPLEFERSLAVPAAGLYQAVILRNTGERELTVAGSSYLPPPLEEGRLFIAQGEPSSSLERLEAAVSPANRREAERTGSFYPDVEGFELRPAASIGTLLGPGEALVMAWVAASLPSPLTPTSFELSPVIDYQLEAEERQLRLGLPVAVRRDP